MIFSFLTLQLLSSCGGNEIETVEIDEEVLDPNSSLNTNFDGKIFSIPSPIQTSILIKESNVPYNEKLLNPTTNLANYTTEYQRAINLGIYGTDLGYATLYDQNGTALKYLSTIEKLTNSLDLSNAFDKHFMSRFDLNSSNQDSVLVIVSEAFRKADSYLKSNDRKNTSVLILTGGWIESLYFACELAKTKSNKLVMDRIGEQQETLNTIIEILELYNKKGSNDELIEEMKMLKQSFDKIEITYEFIAPKTDAEKKLTTLQHKSKVKITNGILNEISTKITAIRSKIIS
jgi:hypothetical protein